MAILSLEYIYIAMYTYVLRRPNYQEFHDCTYIYMPLIFSVHIARI